MIHIYAHTPNGTIGSNEYVEFINISQKLDGDYRLIVRQRSEHPTPQAFIDLSADELRNLVIHVGDALNLDVRPR